MLGKLFSARNRRDVRAQKAKDIFVRKGPSLDAYGFSYPNSSQGRSNPAVVSCVSRIVSRALEVPIELPGKATSERPYLDIYDWRKFWRCVFERVLYEGCAYLYLEGNRRLALANSGDIVQASEGREPTYTLTTYDNSLLPKTITKPHNEVAVITFNDDGRCPYELVRQAGAAYVETMDDLFQASKYERRFSSELEINKNYTATPDQLDEQMADIRSSAQSGRKYQMPLLGYGINFRPRFFAGSAPHKDRLETSLAYIARLYGVPMQLLMVGSGQRMDIEQLDANLMRDAVLPMLKNIASGLSRIYGQEVMIDESKTALPTRTGMTGNMMTLSQTGALTINEIREVAGYPPIEGGDELPQTAGAAERESNSGNEQDEGGGMDDEKE